MYIGLHVNYLLFLSDFKQLEYPLQIFEKYLNIKFPIKSIQWELSLSKKGRQADTMKLIVTLCNFVKVPKNCCLEH